MSAHTPGPWEARWTDNPRGDERDAGVRIIDATEDTEIASVHGGLETFERDANARLIAAAPDLLAAVEAYDLAFNAYNEAEDIADAWHTLEAANRKARAVLDAIRK